jgi:hypothetical protein
MQIASLSLAMTVTGHREEQGDEAICKHGQIASLRSQ